MIKNMYHLKMFACTKCK